MKNTIRKTTFINGKTILLLLFFACTIYSSSGQNILAPLDTINIPSCENANAGTWYLGGNEVIQQVTNTEVPDWISDFNPYISFSFLSYPISPPLFPSKILMIMPY